jgi:hypothetical protein
MLNQLLPRPSTQIGCSVRTQKEMRVTRRFRLCSLVLLVCSASTNAQEQYYLFWQHADGRRAVWTMEGTTQRRGQLIETELLPDPDPLWQIVEAGSESMLFQHQGDGRLAGWEMLCEGPYRTFELSPSVPDLNWKLRGSGYFNRHYPYLIWQNELTGQIGAWKMGGYGTIRRRDRLDGQLLTPSEVPDTNWRIVGIADFNLDGQTDLLWQHQTSGLIALWYMNGLTKIEGGGVLL